MGKADITREKILEASIFLLKNAQEAEFNMRNIASTCDVAVGSIYNYFPTKSDLVMAMVERIWSKVFHPQICMVEQEPCFTKAVSTLYERAYATQKEYHNFFSRHQSLIGSEHREQAKRKMSQYFSHIHRAMEDCLNHDASIPKTIWTTDFTKAQLVQFTFVNILTSLGKSEPNCQFLIELLKRTLYRN